MSSLLVSIDRTQLALSPLVLTGASTPGTIAVSGYQEPTIRHRITYAPDSDYVHGSVPLAASLEDSLLSFDASPRGESEVATRNLMAELRVALNQWQYVVTVTVNGVAEDWLCRPGSVGGAERTYVNLASFKTVWPVTIPCYPVRS